MLDILHRVGIKSSLAEVYKALAPRDGVAAWWTNNTQGESKVGGTLKFSFSADDIKIDIAAIEAARRGAADAR